MMTLETRKIQPTTKPMSDLLRLKDPSLVPNGRFRFTVPENGTFIGGHLSLDSLLDAVKAHYETNAIPLPDNWKQLVEDQLCHQLPAGDCTYEDKTPSRGRPNLLSAENVLHAAMSLSKLIAEAGTGKDVFVDQETAETRAKICVRCFNNTNTAFCGGCAAARKITEFIAKIRGKRRTASDGRLMACGMCGCRNEAIVHVKKEILLFGENCKTTQDRPDWCWLKNDNLTLAQEQLKL